MKFTVRGWSRDRGTRTLISDRLICSRSGPDAFADTPSTVVSHGSETEIRGGINWPHKGKYYFELSFDEEDIAFLIFRTYQGKRIIHSLIEAGVISREDVLAYVSENASIRELTSSSHATEEGAVLRQERENLIKNLDIGMLSYQGDTHKLRKAGLNTVGDLCKLRKSEVVQLVERRGAWGHSSRRLEKALAEFDLGFHEESDEEQ